MANIIKFDYDNNLILEKIIEQPLVVGQSNFYNFVFQFISGGNLMWDDEWKVVAIFERPDLEKTNELLLTRSGPFYEKKLTAWISDVEGNLKITVRIKTEDNTVIQAFPIVIFEVEEGLKPSGDTISEAHYDGILSDINEVNNKIEGHIADVDNPHDTTPHKIGTYTDVEIDNKDAQVLSEAKAYADDVQIEINLGNYYNKPEIDEKLEKLEVNGGYL